MKCFLIPLATATLYMGAAMAQAPANIEGLYETPKGSGPTVSLELIVLDPENGIVAASTSLNDPPNATRSMACGGDVQGLGQISGRQLVFAPYDQTGEGKDCRITATFDSAYRNVRFSQTPACARFSGWSCEWRGLKASKVDPWKQQDRSRPVPHKGN